MEEFYQLNEPPLTPAVGGSGGQEEVPAELLKSWRQCCKFLSPVDFNQVRRILHYDNYITKQFTDISVTLYFNCYYLFRQLSQDRAYQHQEKRKSSVLNFSLSKISRHPGHYMRKFCMYLLLQFWMALLTFLPAKKIKKDQIIWDIALLLDINLVKDLTEKSLYFYTLYVIGWNSVRL